MSALSKCALLLVAASLVVPGTVGTAAAQRGGVHKPLKKKEDPKQKQDPPAVPAYTPTPLQAVPLDQTPAVAPDVKFSDGQLKIVAHNSTLSDVLKAVRKQTGSDFDVPSTANERVVADIGPGPAREVLVELLNGTHFNYVIVGSSTDPSAVQNILLTPKTGGPETATAGPPNRPGMPPRAFPGMMNQGQQPGNAQMGDDSSDSSDDAADQNDAQDEPPQTQPADQQNAGQTPKTPEQLLQELQRQQQQAQQNQQQGNQPGQPGQQPQPGLFPNQPPTQAQPTKPD